MTRSINLTFTLQMVKNIIITGIFRQNDNLHTQLKSITSWNVHYITGNSSFNVLENTINNCQWMIYIQMFQQICILLTKNI